MADCELTDTSEVVVVPDVVKNEVVMEESVVVVETVESHEQSHVSVSVLDPLVAVIVSVFVLADSVIVEVVSLDEEAVSVMSVPNIADCPDVLSLDCVDWPEELLVESSP